MTKIKVFWKSKKFKTIGKGRKGRELLKVKTNEPKRKEKLSEIKSIYSNNRN